MSFINKPAGATALPSIGGDIDQRCSVEITPYYSHDGAGHTLTLIMTEYFGSTRAHSIYEQTTLMDEDDIVNEGTDAQYRASDYLQAIGVADAYCECDWGRALIKVIDKQKAFADYAIAAE